ncbi:unnamed protein product [Arabis nemorensis]|uniref:Uncharacterized protein n=1 Tax=Arabis nemorensis TaxID=586526 RepID=A0A565AND2_9BRAS|nr:unnamed protein product [Arabis nemorensis]
MAENFQAKLYLDEDTKNLPYDMRADRFVQRINRILQPFDPELKLVSATAYGAFTTHELIPDQEKVTLESTYTHPDVAFSFNYLPARPPMCKDCKDDATVPKKPKKKLSYLKLKEIMLQDLHLELEDADTKLSPIVICTSDEDFEEVIELIISWGFKVILLTNVDAEDSLKNSAHLCSTSWF